MIKRVLAGITAVSLLIAGSFIWFKFDRPIETVVIEGDLTGAEQGVMQQHIRGLELPGILSLNLPPSKLNCKKWIGRAGSTCVGVGQISW